MIIIKSAEKSGAIVIYTKYWGLQNGNETTGVLQYYHPLSCDPTSTYQNDIKSALSFGLENKWID